MAKNVKISLGVDRNAKLHASAYERSYNLEKPEIFIRYIIFSVSCATGRNLYPLQPKKWLIPRQIDLPINIIDLLFTFGINTAENTPNFNPHYRLKT